MMIPGGATIPSSAGLSRAYAPQTSYTPPPSPPAAKEDLTRRFDSVTISENAGSSDWMELKSRIHREVRAVPSTDTIDRLREEIRSGAFRPDAREIARKMLLFEEAV